MKTCAQACLSEPLLSVPLCFSFTQNSCPMTFGFLPAVLIMNLESSPGQASLFSCALSGNPDCNLTNNSRISFIFSLSTTETYKSVFKNLSFNSCGKLSKVIPPQEHCSSSKNLGNPVLSFLGS